MARSPGVQPTASTSSSGPGRQLRWPTSGMSRVSDGTASRTDPSARGGSAARWLGRLYLRLRVHPPEPCFRGLLEPLVDRRARLEERVELAVVDPEQFAWRERGGRCGARP